MTTENWFCGTERGNIPSILEVFDEPSSQEDMIVIDYKHLSGEPCVTKVERKTQDASPFDLNAVLRAIQVGECEQGWTLIGDAIMARRYLGRVEFMNEAGEVLDVAPTATLLRRCFGELLRPGIFLSDFGLHLSVELLHQGILYEIDAEVLSELKQGDAKFELPPSCEFAILDEYATLA